MRKNKLLLLLALLMTAATGAWAQDAYKVSMKDGVKDADKWTISPNPAPEGSPVTIQYTGRLKVKGVTATSEAAAAAKTLAEVTAGDIGKIVGKDGKIYATKADAEAVATGNAVAMIAYVGTASDCAHGLAIALADESGTKTYEAAGTACSGKAAVTGGTWRLPSIKDWQYMLIGCGASGSYSDNPNQMSCSELASKLNTAQGDALQTGYYWSSTEAGTDYAWTVYFGGDYAPFYDVWEGFEYRVRACLAFTVEQAEATPALSITSPSVGQVIGSDGKNYAYGSVPSGVTAVAKICYVSGSNGLALALADEGTLDWSTAIETCAAHTPAFTGGTWKLASLDEWNNMITAAGSQTDLRDGFSSVGGTNMEENCYWSSSEVDSESAWLYYFGNGQGYSNDDEKDYGYYVRACLAFTGEQAAKPAATVTTAPTGAAIVGRLNTNSTALVSGGAADGGTLWYAVTTTNTKPTSTAGFSDAVPTAQDITASGKVYVWYYVKADDTHSDSEIAATAIEVPVADVVWDVTNVSDIGVDDTKPYEKEGVTLSANEVNVFAWWDDYGDPTMDGIEFDAEHSGGYTFTAPAGKAFTKIEMKAQDSFGWDSANLGTGWAFNNLTVTWKGTAAASTVELLTDDIFNGSNVKSIAFTVEQAAPAANIVDLSTLTADYEAQNGDVLTRTLGKKVKISIANGATVTLDNATINGGNNDNCEWAGLNCLGNATIVLKDGTTNTVKGFYEEYPGIHVPAGSKLTIQGGTEGTGKLTASPCDGGGTNDSHGAGIGGGYQIACGDISIEGGVITANGGCYAAGIGGGTDGSCGNITITGGDITATGGQQAAGIGSGYEHTCGNITIASTVKKVTATAGEYAPHSIGKGTDGSCGTVTIGGTVYWQDNAAVNGGDTYLATSPLIYDPSN